MTITKEAIAALAEKAGISLEHAEHVLRSEQTGGRPQTNPWPLGPKVNKTEVQLAIDLLERQGVTRAEATDTVIATGDLSIIQAQIDAERQRQQEAADEEAKNHWLTYTEDGLKYQAAQHEAAKAERAKSLALGDSIAEMRGIDPEMLTEEERLSLTVPPDPAQADTYENNVRKLTEIEAAQEGGDE